MFAAAVASIAGVAVAKPETGSPEANKIYSTVCGDHANCQDLSQPE